MGPGPQARRTLATFLLWKVARPQAEYSLKQNRDFAAAAASFFLSDQKETKESPGVSFVRKALRLCLALSLTIPPAPRFTGEPEGCVGSRGRRGNLLCSVKKLSLPFSSMSWTACSYKMQYA